MIGLQIAHQQHKLQKGSLISWIIKICVMLGSIIGDIVGSIYEFHNIDEGVPVFLGGVRIYG